MLPFLFCMESLRKWNNTHLQETIESVKDQMLEDVLFYECELKNVSGATFRNCCLTESKFNPERLEDMLGVTMTLDCNHFSNVEYNELAFDYLLLLLCRTKGNTEKRKKIVELVLGKRRAKELLVAAHRNWWDRVR